MTGMKGQNKKLHLLKIYAGLNLCNLSYGSLRGWLSPKGPLNRHMVSKKHTNTLWTISRRTISEVISSAFASSSSSKLTMDARLESYLATKLERHKISHTSKSDQAFSLTYQSQSARKCRRRWRWWGAWAQTRTWNRWPPPWIASTKAPP